MPYFKFNNLKISAVATAVPTRVRKVEEFNDAFGEDHVRHFTESTGVEQFRQTAEHQTASDLCYAAAEKVIAEKGIDRSTVGALVFVAHSTDYRRPATACVLHKRLGLEKGKYILLSAHREENIDTEKNFTSLFTAINQMAEKYDLPILYSCHPRSRKRLEESGFALDPRVIRHEPLGFHDYNCLQMNAFCVVSDSGTLPEESSFFVSIGKPVPAVCIRTSTERPEALDKGCFILSGIDTKGLLQAVDTAVEMVRQEKDGGAVPVPDYKDINVSDKVVKIIQSYVGVVNKMVWRKDI